MPTHQSTPADRPARPRRTLASRLLRALSVGVGTLTLAGGYAAIIAAQATAAGRYGLLGSLAPVMADHRLDWALTAVAAAWPAALALAFLAFVVRRTWIPLVLALVVVWAGTRTLHSEAREWKPVDDPWFFLPPAVEYPEMPEVSDVPDASEERPHVVLITVDTLRADHLGLYGYERATSPFLDRVAERAAVFDAAIAQAPATRASISSLLTGLYPDVIAFENSQRRKEGGAYVSTGFHLLAERLQGAGYRTGAVVSNAYLKASNGFGQGFDHFDDTSAMFGPEGDERRRSARHVVDVGLDWLAGHDGGSAPAFLWLHVLDPHHPYEPDAPGPWEDTESETFRAFDAESTAWSVDEMTDHYRRLEAGEAVWRDGELDYLVGRYDAEILQTDLEIERLVAALAERGLDEENTLFVLTADHGEEFWDHGKLLHGHTLFDELVHVPLLVWGAGVEPARIEAPVRLIDIVPTVLDAAGLAADPPDRADGTTSLSGRSLLPLMRMASSGDDWGDDSGGDLDEIDWNVIDWNVAPPALTFLHLGHFTLRTADTKLDLPYYIYPGACPEDAVSPAAAYASLGWLARARYANRYHLPVKRTSLYDLRTDPEQRHDLLADVAVPENVKDLELEPVELDTIVDTGLAGDLHRLYCEAVRQLRASPRRLIDAEVDLGLDEDDLEALRSLGYAE